ncbi:MAG: tetratricopeptide repeat protein [Leptolyngbyaceae cyanobacterium bins.302]|nr:tetratricopeptide repeat protein [Leptolyngbyaceae cyanobacterium bins.302]
MSAVWMRRQIAIAIALWSVVSMGNNTAIAQLSEPSSTPLPPSAPNPQSNPQPPTPNPQLSPNPQPSPKPQTPKKQPPPDKFPPNPLEISEPLDPLIPYDYKNRPLTADERRELVKAADRLALIGAQRLQAQDSVGAYEAWNQELRYRRVAGFLVGEVQALGRVGDAAWGQTNTQQLRYITKRLDDIRLQTEKPIAQLENDAKTPPELANPKQRMDVIEALGFAYQQVRLPKISASLFEQVLANARQQGDDLKLEATLINLGQLHLGWFDYPNAARVYRELWQRSQARQDLFNEPLYLGQLIFVHEQAKQPKETIFYQQQLIEFHRKVNDPKPVPALIKRIADNQQTLGQLDRAEANYQLAYKSAQPQLQWAVAGDALKKLGEMYRSNDRLDSAQRIYTFLVNVEQQAYNSYGIMEAYDQLGQIHVQQQQYSEAIVAFEQGREIARQLKFREEYFTDQIQKAAEQAGK